MPARSVVVMGVAGSGKSTIGLLLAKRTDGHFQDGDQLHPDANVRKMSAGIPLTDEDRLPWLRAVGAYLLHGTYRGTTEIVACSALKRAYRDTLREFVPDVYFVHLDGPSDLIADRVRARNHEFMPPALLASQLATLEPLEPDELGSRFSIDSPPETIVDEIIARMQNHPATVPLAQKDR
jgi:gluconokinase